MTAQLTIKLNTGAAMPLLGLGVYDVHGKETVDAVVTALETGYRLIDTAASYDNEVEVGQGLRASGVKREEIFLTTKVANEDQGFDHTLRAFDDSMRKLNAGYIDLYLVHWPVKATRKETWRALERLYQEGRVRAIGVANYLPPFLDELSLHAAVVPAVDQVEFSPYLFLEELLTMCRNKGIVLQAYTPLMRGKKFNDPRLIALATAYSKTPAQIILRWALQLGVSTIPKSSNPQRIRENFDVFDFSISPGHMESIRSWNEEFRVVDDPLSML
ncbi:MAG: aldo/keto reductase [Bacteroidota bacterium]